MILPTRQPTPGLNSMITRHYPGLRETPIGFLKGERTGGETTDKRPHNMLQAEREEYCSL